MRGSASRIVHGTLAGNPFADATGAFFRSMEASVFQALQRRVAIEAPLSRLQKADVICRLDSRLRGLTFSCIAPRERTHCGRCNKCAERMRAFEAAPGGCAFHLIEDAGHFAAYEQPQTVVRHLAEWLLTEVR